MKATCENCRYWKPDHVNDGFEHYGFCKRRSPSPIFEIVVRKARAELSALYRKDIQTGLSLVDMEAFWPLTPFDNWCGDFAEKTS